MNKLALILSLIALNSCANVYNYSDKDFGDTDQYKTKIKFYIKSTAKDPDSIKILNMSEAKKTFIQNMKPSALWEPFFPVLGVCVTYKGTNSFGANRVTTENFFIKDDSVLYNVTTLDKYEPCSMR
jgi:hypothetical protein